MNRLLNSYKKLIKFTVKYTRKMEAINAILDARIRRTDLVKDVCYEKIRTVRGEQFTECVGIFVRSYRMGSGDGMTAHWEFNKDGTIIRVDDDMWGSVAGTELIGFRPCTVQPSA
jgi:hypothetical protein